MGTVLRRDPVDHGVYLLAHRGVPAQSEDQEGAEEGGVRLLKEAAEGRGGCFRAEDHGEGVGSL